MLSLLLLNELVLLLLKDLVLLLLLKKLVLLQLNLDLESLGVLLNSQRISCWCFKPQSGRK